MIYKILTGNEHGGAAVSSQEIIDYFSRSRKNYVVIFLCSGDFALSNAEKYDNVILLDSYCPPIITASSVLKKMLNSVNFIFWTIYTLVKFLLLIYRLKIKNIHTTNNHALLIVLLAKAIGQKLYIVSHWRCVGLASASNYKNLLQYIDLIVCISEAVQRSLPNNLYHKTVVIYDGIDTKALLLEGNKHRGILRQRLGIDISDFVIGTIGSFTPIKCHELIIDAVSKCNIANLSVVLIGSCPNNESEYHLKMLKDKVFSLGLEKQIHLVLDNFFEKPSLYIQDFDLFVGATWNSGLGEGFGLIYIEAMSQELPVVAINVGAAAEIVADSISGFLMKSNDSEELATIIEYSATHRQLLKQMGQQGLTSVSRFDIRNTVHSLEEIYLKMD